MKATVFQQLLKPITTELMKECTRRFGSDYDYETFKTWDHLVTMIYAQIHELKSLRTLEVAINSQEIGLATQLSRSTLSDANKQRPAECFFWLLEQLMSLLPRKMRKDVNKLVKILDSSPIKLKGSGYAELYKARWAVELFFKWIKQNLKIKKFLGRSANAVKIQIGTALIAYLLVQIFKNASGDERRLQLVLVWVKCNLHARTCGIRKYKPPTYQFLQQPLWINRGVVCL